VVTITVASPPAAAGPLPVPDTAATTGPPRLSASQLLPIEDGRLVDTDESDTGLDPVEEVRMSRIKYLRDRCRKYFRGNKVYGPLVDGCVGIAEEDFRTDRASFLDIAELTTIWPDPTAGVQWRTWDDNMNNLMARIDDLLREDRNLNLEVRRRVIDYVGRDFWPST
jgi:hypothetical protein